MPIETLRPGGRTRKALSRSRLVRGAVTRLRHRGLREHDIFLASYPRSGNTWLRFVLVDLATGVPADFESVDRLAPGVGTHGNSPDLVPGGRLIKTHEPYRSDYRSAIYLVRDVRDVLVSWYRVNQDDPEDTENLDAFVEDFTTRKASPYGSWSDHVRGWREAAMNSPVVQFRRFEDLRAAPVAGVLDIATSIGLEVDRPAVEKALERNSSERMHALERDSAEFLRRSFGYRSRGVRSGSGGDWRGLLSEHHLRLLAPALELNRELGYG